VNDRFRGEYSGDWDAVSAAAKADAGDRCVRCGHPNGDTQRRATAWDAVESADPGLRGESIKHLVPCDDRCTHARDGKLRVLTVHHLDGDKSNNRWWNLLPLCQVCHLQIQARVVPERPWLVQHSPWFVPYVCGFYARYYGGVDITRAEADADADRYLALGQPWLYASAGVASGVAP
jgi:hypothetical protein